MPTQQKDLQHLVQQVAQSSLFILKGAANVPNNPFSTFVTLFLKG